MMPHAQRPSHDAPAPTAGPPASAPPPLIGLTGGLGAGKSTALAALERLGAAALSTDAVVHELYESSQIRDAVVARWGSEVAPSDTVDRAAVAAHAFSDAGERAWLEGLLWPRVGARVADWVRESRARRPAPRAIVVETPLLFEAGMEAMYDATVAVVADEGLRSERAAGRGHALVDERSARQLTQAQKADRASFVVSNDGDVADLQLELSGVLDKLSA